MADSQTVEFSEGVGDAFVPAVRQVIARQGHDTDASGGERGQVGGIRTGRRNVGRHLPTPARVRYLEVTDGELGWRRQGAMPLSQWSGIGFIQHQVTTEHQTLHGHGSSGRSSQEGSAAPLSTVMTVPATPASRRRSR